MREDGDRTAAVRPGERPGRQQAERHPADVDQRREEVVAEEEDAGRVEQLGVLRVEPDGQVEDLGEVEGSHLVVLDEAGREGGVVPGGVRQVHADVEPGLGGHRPVRGDQQGRGDRDGERDRGDLRRPAAAVRSPAAAGRPRSRPRRPARRAAPSRADRGPTTPTSSRVTTSSERPSTTSASRAEAPDQPGRSRPRRPTAAKPMAAATSDQLDRALQVVAEAHVCAAAPSCAQVDGSSGPVIL